MVESLKELNKICQKKDYKTKGNWMVRHILRDAALPITWFLLHTSVTANQVTLFSLILGLAGLSFYAFPGWACFLTGSILLQIWYLFDHVDGQIARYRGTVTLSGRFFDFLMHHIIHGILFFPLGWFGFFQSGSPIFLLMGFWTSCSMMIFNFSYDIQYKAFHERLFSVKKIEVLKDNFTPASTTPYHQGTFILKRTFAILHKMIEMHVIMNTFTVCAVLQAFFWRKVDLRFFLLGIFSILIPLLTSIRLVYWIRSRRIDSDFFRAYKIISE